MTQGFKCNCRSLPPYFAVPEKGCEDGAEIFERFLCVTLSDQNLENVGESTASSGSTYRCTPCGQLWYLELATEPEFYPVFAMKVRAAPDAASVESVRQFLLVLAHVGFSTETCLLVGCSHFALKNRAYCHAHWPL